MVRAGSAERLDGAAGHGARLLRGRRAGHRLQRRDRGGHGLHGHAPRLASWRPSTACTPNRWAAPSTTTRRPRSRRTWATSATKCPRSTPSSASNRTALCHHQAAFADACATPSADQAVFDGALAMALTVIDMATDEAIRDRLLARVARDTPSRNRMRPLPTWAAPRGQASRCPTLGKPRTGHGRGSTRQVQPPTPRATPGCAGGRCWARTRVGSRTAASVCRPDTR